MAELESLLLFVVAPLVAWTASFLVLRGRYQDVERDWSSRGLTPPFSRLVVVSVYGAVPFALGLVLWILSRAVAAAIDGGTMPAKADAARLLLWSGVAYAVAASCTVAGQTLVVRARMSGLLGSDFGRILPISVIPFTDTIFALLLVFLLLGYLGDVPFGTRPASTTSADAATAAFQAYAVASVAMPVSAAVSNRIKDLSTRGFTRALIVADIGELPILAGLVACFLAIRGLYPV